MNSPFSSTPSSYDDDDKGRMMMIRDKIRSAFSSVSGLYINGGLIQFWNTNIGSSTRLSTENQPFVLDPLKDPLANEYRLFSLKCQHTITSIIHVKKEEDPTPATCLINNRANGPHAAALMHVKEEDPAASCLINNITSGPHAAALRVPHFPEVILNLKWKKGSSPLVDKALDRGMTCLILLPVFYQSKFVGVVEFCRKHTLGMVQVFSKLKRALESVGLITYNTQHHLLPAKATMHGLNRAQDEIEEALKIVCASHQVAIAQVWINYDVVFKQSCTNPDQLGRMTRVVKLCGYHSTDNYDDACYVDLKVYYDACNVLTLDPGEGFPGKTLETHKPYFCKSLYSVMMSHKDGLLGALRQKTGSSCFTICLRSAHTGSSVDYAFEFLWSCRRQNQSVLLECLLLTLKMCLPSFEFASGAQLGEELSVFDVTAKHQLLADSNTHDQIPSFKLLQGNKFSLESKGISGLQRPVVDLGKRKLRDLYYEVGKKGNTEFHHYLVAEYRETRAVIVNLEQAAYTLAYVKKKVEKEFNLDPGSCMLEYEHRGERVMVNTEENLSSCIQLWRHMNNSKTSDRKVLFKVRVLLSTDVQINKWLSSYGLIIYGT